MNPPNTISAGDVKLSNIFSTTVFTYNTLLIQTPETYDCICYYLSLTTLSDK